MTCKRALKEARGFNWSWPELRTAVWTGEPRRSLKRLMDPIGDTLPAEAGILTWDQRAESDN